MKLNFHVIGTGPPLLILHGLLGSLDNWAPHATSLATDFSVFTIDLRNHGRSPHADEFNYDVMAADLVEFVRDQNLGPVNLIGHSMGGKVAMRFAQLHPELTQRLIVADMAPREYPPRYREILATMQALDLSRMLQRAEVEAALMTVAPDRLIRQFLLKNIGRDAQGNLRWKPNIAALHANYDMIRAALPTVQFAGPTLFIRGGRSDYIRAEDVGLIQQLFPHVRLETIASAGHWVHAEAPESFLQITKTFLLAAKEESAP